MSCTFLLVLAPPASTELFTLPLHDALPISDSSGHVAGLFFQKATGPEYRFVLLSQQPAAVSGRIDLAGPLPSDRKSTRLNSSHSSISYAVFCLQKNISPHILC